MIELVKEMKHFMKYSANGKTGILTRKIVSKSGGDTKAPEVSICLTRLLVRNPESSATDAIINPESRSKAQMIIDNYIHIFSKGCLHYCG